MIYRILRPTGAPEWLAGVLQSIERLFREQEKTLTASPISEASFETLPENYANDAAAAVGGVPVKGIYRNGSVLMVRVS